MTDVYLNGLKFNPLPNTAANLYGMGSGGHKKLVTDPVTGQGMYLYELMFLSAQRDQARAYDTISATSLTIGIGSIEFTMTAAKPLSVGMIYELVDQADAANYLHGNITAVVDDVATLNVTTVGGSGTISAWYGNLAGRTGPEGATIGIKYKAGTWDVTDDINAGYLVGETLIDTANQEAYICLNNAVGAAVWHNTTTVKITELSDLAFKDESELNLDADTITHQILGEITEDLEVVLVGDLAAEIDISASRVKLTSGTATVTFKKGGVAINGTAHSATSTATLGTHTENCLAGSIITAVFTGITSPVDCFITLNITRG